MEPDELSKCYFLPHSSLKKALEILDTKITNSQKCKTSLLQLQQEATVSVTTRAKDNWRYNFFQAVNRAIYSHNWDKLLYLLKKSPIWEHHPLGTVREFDILQWTRAYVILLMYHPEAKFRGHIYEYLHLVLGCVHEQNKKAMMKVLLSTQEKIHSKVIRGISDTEYI